MKLPRHHQKNTIIFDHDGDGDDDLVIAHRGRIRRMTNCGDRVINDESRSIPSGYGMDGMAPVHGPIDLDDDGRPEFAFSSLAASGEHWRFWILDPRAWRVVDSFDLPVVDGEKRDGVWDGSYELQAIIDIPTDHGQRRGYIISVTAGYDCRPRGLLAVDCTTHEVLWRHFAGPQIRHPYVVVDDLDGEGTPGIYCGASGVGNVDAAMGHGISDEFAVVYAVAPDGTRRWMKAFGRQPASAALLASDLDGDGTKELIVCHGSDRGGEVVSALEILDAASGATISTWDCGEKIRLPRPLRRGTGHDLIAHTMDRRIVRLEYRDGELRERAWALFRTSVYLVACLDLLGEADPQVIVLLGGEKLVVLDAWLSKVLAWRDIDDAFPEPFELLPWTMLGRDRAVTVTAVESRNGLVELGVAETAAPEGLLGFVAGVVVAAALCLLLAWLIWRRRKGELANEPDGLQPKRDRQLRLLDDLVAENHGEIGALKNARSVVRLLRMVGGGHLTETEMVVRRTEELQRSWVRLDEIIDRCEASEQSPAMVLAGREAFASMREQVDRLVLADFAPTTVAAQLPELLEIWRVGEAAMTAMRDDLEEQFTTDLEGSVDRVLKLHANGLEGVEVVRSGLVRRTLRIHRVDLEWVLDSLIDNAIRAMREQSERILSIEATTVDETCLCIVGDTGTGMDSQVLDKLGRQRVSERRGGGSGWMLGTAMLERYGGEMKILVTEKGVGTRVGVFLESLPSER